MEERFNAPVQSGILLGVHLGSVGFLTLLAEQCGTIVRKSGIEVAKFFESLMARLEDLGEGLAGGNSGLPYQGLGVGGLEGLGVVAGPRVGRDLCQLSS